MWVCYYTKETNDYPHRFNLGYQLLNYYTVNGDFNHQEISFNPQEMFHSLKDGYLQAHFPT
jgi:hypothetical protein